MRRHLPPLGVILAFLILWFFWKSHPGVSSDSIEYQGQSIKLSKSYSDYDDFKNDPHNLAAHEIGRVQKLVESAPIARQFATREHMIHAVFALKFPGYGLDSFGEKPRPDGSVLALHSVEIPQSGNSRFLLFRGSGGTYTLLDDFVHADSASIQSVASTGDKLVYSTAQGAKVLEHPQPAK